MDSLIPLARALGERGVRFALIGVAGANYYAYTRSASFVTQDRDLFLLHIVTSKQAAGRDKDRLFLATHREALETLLRSQET